MRDYSALKVVIDANINRNGRQAITGSILNSVLTAMIDSLGGGYLFMGMASPTTDPGNIDAKVFYLAVVPGRYEHMGNVVIGDGEVAIINHTEGAWTKVTTGIASHDDIEDIKDELESLFGDIAGISTELGNKMTFCELWSDGNIITMKDSETPLTFTEVKGMVDDPSLFVALKLGLIWWLLPQYDDMGGAIVFTGTSLLSAQGSVDRVAINMENRVSSYSIAIENAFLKTDDLEKEKIDNFNTYPTTHAVNAGLEGKQDIISDLETIRTEIKKVGQLELKIDEIEDKTDFFSKDEATDKAEEIIIAENDGKQVTSISLDGVSMREGVVFGESINNPSVIITNDGLKVKTIASIDGRPIWGLPCVVVDKNGKGDYTTIQSAINNTKDGDVIFIMGGRYEEIVKCWGKKRHLVGISRDAVILTNGTGNYTTPPLEMNIGSVSNMTIIADNYAPTTTDPATTNTLGSYGIHIEYANSTPFEFNLINCRIESMWSAGLGIGLRYNQTINIIDCELISHSESMWSSASSKRVYMGGLYFHNDASGANKDGGRINIRNTYMKGLSNACTIQSVNNGSGSIAEFIGCTLIDETHGIGEGVIYKWGLPTAQGKLSGNDISLAITSHSNNINELNNM